MLLSILTGLIATTVDRCGSDNGDEPTPQTGGITNISIDSSRTNGCESSTDPCSYTYWLSFDDPPDDQYHYYWAEIVLKNPYQYNESVGNPMEIYNHTTRKQISMTAHYFDLPNTPDYAWVYVMRCDDIANAGKRASNTGQYQGSESIGAFDSSCGTCCCSKPSPRYWAFAAKQLGNVTGIRCSLDTRYGKLCGEDCGSEDSAWTCAWIGILEEYGDKTTPFIQAGYMRWRMPPEMGTSIEEILYLEFKPSDSDMSMFMPLYAAPPVVGTRNDYELTIDIPTQDFNFFYNGDPVGGFTLQSGTWQSSKGEWAAWSGEINGHETDMPGFSGNKCEFAGCQYSFDGGGYYYDAQFDCPPDTIGTSNRAEWDLHYYSGSNNFRIWDKNPQ